MSPKNKKGKKLTSTIMALAMTVTTTFQMPIISMASEIESSVAVESQIEEGTSEESVSVQSETTAQTNAEQTNSVIEETSGTTEATNDATQVSDEVQATVAETTAEVTYEEEKTTLSSEVDPSGEDIEESKANETRGPDETIETTTQAAEEETSAEVETESESETTEESTQADPFASLDPTSGLTEEQLGAIDFSSKRLLVAADESVIIDPEHVLSDYAGVYLMQYDTETQAKYAYAYYYNKSEFVDVDTVISVADGDGSANAAVPMAAEENPIAELQAAVAENPVNAAGAVAVIDTGVNDVANVTESVSMIGDNTADENGHGTRMAQLVAEQNPDVSILSIKALGADGTGDISAVYAAIRYAIDKKASVINLSMSAVATAENAALTSIIDEATAAGIAVVGAAGNKGMDVRFFVPGNIESAYIIGAADEDGARITSSNYGSTVDFNVHADSTSEAAAKFSGYYTVNGAVADEKLVFPTDYSKPEVNIDFNGPIINHQISYYNYEGSSEDLVWVSQKTMKTVLEDDYITTYIGFAEDADLVSKLNVYVDFMSIDNEHSITDECIVDLEKMTVKIPASYKNANLTVRWFMPNASYSYGYDVDAKYMISNTPEKFKAAYNGVNGLTTEMAQQYVAGTYAKGFTHTSNSMNHSYVNYATDGINVGDWFTIQSGYIASVEEYPGIYTTRGEIASMFGPTALANLTPAGSATTQTFLSHFNTVTRDSDGSDVSGWFNTVGGKGNGVIHVDVNNSGSTKDDEPLSAGLGWVFGTCANDEVGGQCPSFTGGKIICTSKDPDGTAYFFFYCTSPRGQWTGGSFSITPKLPKTGFLQIHKSSADPAITNGNSCYNFEGIPYGIFTDAECRNPVTVVTLDANGYSQPYELTAGTYYVREAEAKPGSGYQTNSTVYTIEVTAGTTATAPVMCETTDVPLNDPFGIVINKINADGTTTADLSGAEYTIKYYPKQYNTVAEIQADPEAKATTWVIKTIKDASGNYQAFLDDAHIVSGVSDGAKFGKNTMGTYIIPLGTLTVEETKAPTGFTKDGAVVSSAATGATLTGTNNVYLFNLVDKDSAIYLKSGNALDTAATDETAITLQYAERQINGTPKMEKHDLELNKKAAMGGTNFAGITFEVYCLDDSVIIGNTTYKKGETIETVTSDAEGNVTMTTQYPIGHYAVREKSANNYYTNDGQIHYFNVVEYQGGAFIQYETNMNAVTFTDRVVRGDLSFVKKNADTEETLAYIPFRITNNTTGETHYILTSADGTFTSAVGKTTNTNANDAVLSQYGDKDVIPQSVVDSLAKDAGLWFGMGSEGTMTAANDSYGSFVYGTYTITELKTEATRNMKMYTSTFTIDTDGKVLDLGTVNNVPMGIKTTLVDVNEEHFTEPVSSITLTDHVAYKNLDTDKTYTLTGTLYVKEGDALTELMTETVDFTPAEKNGIQDVTFTFDASALVGKSVVAFEELSLNGEFCAEHKDKDDENQTVTFPSIQTTARDSKTEDHVANATDSVSIIDTVTYSGLKVGETYTITGTLMDADTGKAVLDDDGNEITASKEFVAPVKDGSVDITFNFAGVSLAGKKIVAFEEVYYKGRRYAVHADLSDEGQTVYVPKIRTKALDANTGLNQVKADSNATVVDTVTYENLLPGKKYTMKGVLMTSAGNALMVNGRTITASTEFTPTTPNGSVDVTFNFDASEIGGRKLVFYEYLELDGDTVASHTDISDTDQTIYVPSIKTTIIDSENGSHNAAADEEITLIDTVRYNGLEVGRKYSVTGTLVDKATGKEILDDAGNKITASNEFTAEKPNGTIEITFKFSGVSLAGKTTVAFEHMYTDGKEVAVHADLKDEKQTEYFPSVHTTATSNDTEDHVVGANEKVTITDNVALKALKLGTEYTLSGILMDATTGKPIVIDGNTIIARRTFTADAHEMNVPLTYELNASQLAGTTTVVFEDLYSDGALLASHSDLKDAEQTVYIPEIHTTAKDQTTGINHTEATKDATIVDTVFYTHLLPGKEYTVTGELRNKATGKPIVIGGKRITASTTFVPEKSEGSVDVIFTFDASIVAPKTVVAFETLTYKGIEVAAHADIEDKDQTIYVPKIHTSAIAEDTEDHVTEATKDVTIVDTVTYEQLEVGREYTVKGVLMDKATGKAVLVDGKEVTSETTFTAEEQNGNVDVIFTFDASALEGTTTVVFETLYTEGKEVAVHADLRDAGQTVYLPKIRTHAQDGINEIDHTEALEKATIIDTVTYTNLLPGKEYTVTGTLMDKETGEAVLIDGKPITASTTFTAETAEGSVDIVFEFDASAIAGTTVVAFESMEYKGIEVAVHADIEDENQTVYIPDVHTTATATDTEDHVTGANEEVTITDEVALTGLKVDNEYTIKGVLMDQTTGKELLVDEKQIVSEETFTADQADMTITLTYKLDASKLAGITTVVFETLYTEGKEVGRHHEIDDEGQTVYIPEIHTTAADQKTGINHTESEEQATIVDTVLYSHLLPGKEYTVKGTLMNKETGEAILINGEEVTAETTFTAEKSEGSVDVIFTFDASAIAPTTVVAFESMEYKKIEVAVHADIEDEDQTVYIPEIGTTALGQDTKDHIEKAKEDAVIVDTVEYKGLEVGREYTMTGTLVDKETGEAITDAEGNEITTSEIFVAEEKDGSIDITFKFDASALAGKSLVAFETLYTEGKEVAIHADLEDEGQTIRIPEIHTTATDKVTGDHDGVVAKETTVLDEVFYKNLIPGKEYTVKGTLMVKETGEALVVNGETVTAEKTFTAEEPDGSIILEFTFDSSALAGKKIVAFEDITYEGISIGSHEDLTDEDQTISYPEIHTTAVNGTDGSKTMVLGTNVTLVDTVTYKGLTAGKTYVLKGTIMDKASGQSIGVTAETTFTAEAADGSTTVTFTFDTSVLQGKTLVVFETLYDTNGNQIVAHSDLNDEDQTVTVPVQPENPPVITGDDSTPMPYVAGLAAALLAIVAIIAALVAKRRKQA